MKRITLLLIFATLLKVTNGQTANNKTLVFSTAMLKGTKTLKFNTNEIKLTVKKKCKETGEPPYECWTNITFSGDGFPPLKVRGDGYAFATADINKDGMDELIVLSAEGGNWREVYVYSLGEPTMTSDAFWYQPFDSFGWFPGTEGDNMCDAEIYLTADKKQVVVMTTNPADEKFKCTDKKIFKWTMK